MSFIETVRRSRDLLREEGRISLRGLKREFDLDDEALDDLVEELVDIQQVAVREGKALAWVGNAGQAVAPRESAPEPAAEAERRQLTVLFCDLVESTRLAAGMDPEDWRELVRGYQESAAGIVERFDGHVAQYLGDGLLIYFGWPRAHENDAERAVRSALGIVSAVSKGDARLSVRIGIHTGPVVVGEMGGGASRETLAMGNTTNVAARIEGEAEPDTVVLSSATLRLASGIFVTEDLGERPLKGAGDVHLHRAIRASGTRSRLDVSAAEGLTPLVGRDQELGRLDGSFEQIRNGLGQVMLVSGEAGIGKSRLVRAFRDRIAERAHTWVECRCTSHNQESPLYPLLDLQRQWLGLGREGPERDAENLEASLRQFGFELSRAMPLMARFLGIPLPDRYDEPMLSPEAWRKQTLELYVEWFIGLGRLQPLVLLIEDLHWSDPSTQELLGQILERIPREPMLLLATYRPEFEPPWMVEGAKLAPMLVGDLSREQLGDLVRKTAPDRNLPEAWVEQIIRRADGVPLFAEELTKTVLESHPPLPEGAEVPTLHIPETLQDLLAARLDQLGPVKQVAQLASVLGREFSYDLLLEISPLREDQLQRVLADAVSEELFHEQEAAPDARYFFKHALIRDAAYQSMLHRTRQGHHRLVAETLTDQVPGIAEEQPEVVAHHWSQSDLPERAIPWWQRAGQRSFAVHALEEAIAHLRRGLAQLASQPAGEERDREELAFQWLLARALFAVRGFSTEETRSVYTRAAELCRFELDPRRRAAVMYGVVIAYINSAPLDRAASEAATVLESGRRSGDLATLATGELLTGICRLYEGRIAAACEHTSRAVEVCEQESVSFIEWGFPEDVAPVVRAWQGWALWHAGMAERSERACEGAVVQARSGRDPYSLGVALNWQAFVAIMRRDPPAARRMGKEVRRMADEQGFPFLEDWGQLCLHWADAVESGDVEPVDQFEAVLLKQSKNGSHGAAPWSLEELAALRLIAGQPEAGLRTVELGQAFADRTGEHFRDAGLHRVAGECLVALEPGSEGEAEAHFLEALTISRRQGVKPLELRAATSLARLWRGQGKTAEARELLGPVHAWFTEGFDTQDLKDAQVLLQELS